jgi:ketosteroid isomerase-like protein
MTTHEGRQLAENPNDLGRFFVERANAGDVEGVVALYEPGAVLTFPEGTVATGHAEIREVYAEFLAGGPALTRGRQRPALVSGSLALTSTELASGAVTVEIAHRQPEGFWLWAMDQPAL